MLWVDPSGGEGPHGQTPTMRRWLTLLSLVTFGILFSASSLASDQHAAAPPRPRTDAEALAQRGKTEAATPTPPAAAHAEEHPAEPKQATKPGTKPDAKGGAHAAPHDAPAANAVLAELLAGNGLFAAQHDEQYFAPFARSQSPKVTLLTCSDSRVHTHLFGGNPDNYFFVVRDIGNQMATAQGSIDYGIQHLHTPVLLIIGHSGCGAVKAAMGEFHAEDEDIVHELEPLVPALTASEGEFDRRWAENIEANVDFQVRQALAAYRSRVQDGTLTVLGAVYDFQNAYGKGPGTLVVVNVNGVSSPERIREEPALDRSGAKVLEAHVGRLIAH